MIAMQSKSECERVFIFLFGLSRLCVLTENVKLFLNCEKIHVVNINYY